MYVGVVMVALVGYSSQLLMRWLERKLVPWRAGRESHFSGQG